MRRVIELLIVAGLLAGIFFVAMRAAEAPTLTDLQRLQVVTALQRVEIAVLKAQAIQREFDQAVAERDRVLRTLAVEGFDFDPATLTYRPHPPGDRP